MVTSVYNMMVWDIQIIWSQLAKLKYDFTLFKESSTLTQEDGWLYVYVGFKMASGFGLWGFKCILSAYFFYFLTFNLIKDLANIVVIKEKKQYLL